MAVVEPFAALRVRPDLAARVCELPYDVLSSEEARVAGATNPLSFFHVSKPEIDLRLVTDPYTAEVYAKGRENFDNMIATGCLVQDRQPCYYLYRLIMGQHTQLGVTAVAGCEDYLCGVIRRHELTRPDKEQDRLRHMEALNAQTGPALLIYRAVPAIDRFVAARTSLPPELDFVAPDGIGHSCWVVSEPSEVLFLREQFSRVTNLYIADGHHRTAAAARLCQQRQAASGSNHFLAVLFPHNQARILPYNRVLRDLNGLSERELLERLQPVFDSLAEDGAKPGAKGEIGFYLRGQWRLLKFRPDPLDSSDLVSQLDVVLLQRRVLAPIFGIQDPRTSERVQFVGGVRGSAELERLVDSGQCACAFLLHPLSVPDLMAIADQDRILPPKSTWFEPKLRDGLFSYLL